MNPIIKNSLKNSMTYHAYRELVKQMVDEKSTTGANKSEDFVSHTKLSEQRMKRWDKTIKISEDDTRKIQAFNHKLIWLVIAESWCGDAAHVVPVLNKIAELNPNIDLKIVLRDDNLALMDLYLTNGGRSIPKLIIINAGTGNVLDTYGPRPTEATNYVNRYKAKHGTLTPEFKEDLQHWYNKNKGENVIKDLTELLAEIKL
ncbi:MAG: thioredoxin family protein [Flavobacteriaceae bacterium]